MLSNDVRFGSYLPILVALLICSSCEKRAHNVIVMQRAEMDVRDNRSIPCDFLVLEYELLAVTDANGAFEITTLDPGTYPVRISSTGSQDTRQIVRVEPDNRIYANFNLSKK